MAECALQSRQVEAQVVGPDCHSNFASPGQATLAPMAATEPVHKLGLVLAQLLAPQMGREQSRQLASAQAPTAALQEEVVEVDFRLVGAQAAHRCEARKGSQCCRPRFCAGLCRP